MTKVKILIILAVFLALLIIIVLINCVPYKVKAFKRDILISDSISKEGKGIENLVRSSSLIDVQYINSGYVKVPLSNTINLNHPSCSELKEEDIKVPIFAYLIHHEKYGYFLIDSGCDSSYVNNPYGPMKGLLFPKVMSETELEPDEAIGKQLSEDILNNINALFFTHLHFDHTSGLPSLPDDLAYVAGKGEKSYSIKWLLKPNHFKNNDTIYMIDFKSEDAQTFPIGKAIDIFGDQTVWAISTPGHSKGHISYLVNSKEGPVLIAGDACILNKSLEIRVGPGTSSANIELAQKTLDKICIFIEDNPAVKVWTGHDFPELN